MKTSVKDKGFDKVLLVNKKADFSVFFFFIFFMLMVCTANDINNIITNIGIYKIGPNKIILLIGVCIFFIIISLFKRPYLDNIVLALLCSSILGIIPFIYTENTSHYWGNYLSLLISIVAYYICKQSKSNLSETIFKILCLVSIILSVQVITTEFSYFSNLSFSNFNNIIFKAYLILPIGNSNLIAAYLLPLVVFILTFKRNLITFFISVLSILSIILCRSKNAILLIVLIVLYLVLKIMVEFIIKIKFINKKYVFFILIVFIVTYGVLFIIALSITKTAISDLQFPYDSPYTNHALNYLDTITSGRILIFQNELLRFLKHPFFGNGFGYIVGSAKSHNWVIEVIVERGLVGSTIYLLAIVNIFRKGLRFYNSDIFIRASINLLFIIYLQGLFEVTIFTYGIDFFIWSISGFIISRIKIICYENVKITHGLTSVQENSHSMVIRRNF